VMAKLAVLFELVELAVLFALAELASWLCSSSWRYSPS
jgi:hypothetical protein